MAGDKIGVTMTGGQIQGVAGAGSVVIENFTIYNRAPDEPAASADEPIGPCPYPGLAFFGPNDSALFFGRDAAIERLTAAVTRRSFTALVGSSGSGKSSVVLAGLAPSLHGLGGWRYGYFRIGNELEHDPFLALARALVPLFMASPDGLDRLANTKKLATMLRAGDLTLRDVFADSRGQDKGSRILLIADQFEETFTLVEDEATRNRFIDVLLAGFRDPVSSAAPDVSLILTMRADFYGRALLYRPLADALQGHVENLGPMSREELRAAIVQPAANANLSFDPGLVETLLDDVESKPGSLPLLQFALREMWGRQENRRITRESYDAIGGVQGALAKRAETIFADMTGHGANTAMEAHFQRLFTRLVTPGEGQEDTRRIADRHELGDEVWSLAQRLADEGNRLVVTSAPGPGYETAEVVHEALIRNWPTLTGWINRDRAFLSWLRLIKPTLELWSADRTDEGPLLRGGMLAQASDWFARRGGDFSPAERDYIEASLALRQREDAEREAGRQAEIGRQRELAEAAVKLAVEQRRRARMALVGGIVALLLAVFGVGMGAVAYREAADATQKGEEAIRNFQAAQRNAQKAEAEKAKADRAAIIATARQWAAQAPTDLDLRAPRHLLLALNAISLSRRHDFFDPVESIQLLNNVLTSTGGVPLQHSGPVGMIGLSPGGRWLAAASEGEIRLWDMQAPGATPRTLSGHNKINKIAFSPDGKTLAAAGNDFTLRLWTLGEADPSASERVLKGHTAAVVDAAFKLGSRWVATASADGTARLWDLAASNPETASLVLPHEASAQVNTLAFSPDEHWLATASWTSGKGTLRLWDLASPDPAKDPRLIKVESEIDVVAGTDIHKLAFSPDSVWLALGATETYTVLLIKVATPEMRFPLKVDQWVGQLAFSPDGHWLAAPSQYKARLWDLTKPDPAAAPLFLGGHKGALVDLAFAPDGKWFATASSDQTAQLWSVSDRFTLAAVLRGHEGPLSGLAFDRDGRLLVTASEDSTVRLWDTSSPTAEPLASPAKEGGGDLQVWDLRAVGSRASPRILGDKLDPGATAIFSPDGQWLATVSGNDGHDYFVHLWNLTTASPTRHIVPNITGFLASPVFSPDGRWLATASSGSPAVNLWDLKAPDPVSRPKILRGHRGAVRDLAFSANGALLVSGATDGIALVWNLTETDPSMNPRRLNGGDGSSIVRTVAISGDGRWVITGSWEEDHAARIWDLSNASTASAPKKLSFSGRVFDVAISADGHWAAAGSWDRTTQVLDLTRSDARPIILRGHTARTLSIAFSPDSEWLVTGNEDRTARLWNLTAADPATDSVVLRAPGKVGGVAFSPDGHWLALGQTEFRARPFGHDSALFASTDSEARLFRPRLDDLIALACRTAGRDLAANEVRASIVPLDLNICSAKR